MLGFIIMILVISSVMGNPSGARKLLRALFAFWAVLYGIRILLFTGFHLVPMLVIIWAVMNIAVPFVKGFASSFQKR